MMPVVARKTLMVKNLGVTNAIPVPYITRLFSARTAAQKPSRDVEFTQVCVFYVFRAENVRAV
jgi:hypothetical protein